MCLESYETGLDRGLNVLNQQNFQAPGDIGDTPQCERGSQRQRWRTGFVGFGDGEGDVPSVHCLPSALGVPCPVQQPPAPGACRALD